MPKLKDREPLKRYDFRAPEKLLNDLTEHLGLNEEDQAKAIHIAIDNIILNGETMIGQYQYPFIRIEPPTPKDIPIYIHPYKSKDFCDENSEMKLVPFRESKSKIDFLAYYYRNVRKGTLPYDGFFENATPSTAIRYAIYDTLNDNIEIIENQEKSPKPLIAYNKHLVPYIGQKNADILNEILNICEEIQKAEKTSKYAEPFMGSANVFLHLAQNKFPGANCILNDLDYNMVCLIEMIRDRLMDFKTAYNQLEYSSSCFNDAKRRYKLSNTDKKTLPSMTCALDVFILLHFSYRAKKENFKRAKKGNSNDEGYAMLKRKLWTDAILPLYRIHLRLQSVHVSCQDALYFIDEQLSDKNSKTLFYIDSPYFYSEDVYEACKPGTDSVSEKLFPHEELAQKLIDINNSGNYFVASNRVTVSDTCKENGMSNLLAIEMANKCYTNRGFYYKFALFTGQSRKEKNQVEILISNYPFKDSKPCIQIAEAEVNACIANQ